MLLVFSQSRFNSSQATVKRCFTCIIIYFLLRVPAPQGDKGKVDLLQKPFVLFNIMCFYSLKVQMKAVHA